jgi:hypothetical protein
MPAAVVLSCGGTFKAKEARSHRHDMHTVDAVSTADGADLVYDTGRLVV